MALSKADLKQQASPKGQSATSSHVIGVVTTPPLSRKLGGQLARVLNASLGPDALTISQQALVVVTCWLTPPQSTVGSAQLPLKQRWWLPVGPQGVRLSTLRSAGQSAAVLHWLTPRHIADVRVSVTLHTPLQVTSWQRGSSAGATQAPVPDWQVAQTPEQVPAQQNPPVQIPLWH
jgi:hypothetical protein